MAKAYKNNIFEVIKQMDYKNYGYYDSLSDDLKKEIQPYTLLRWESCASGNENSHKELTLKANRVNEHFWELSKYKDLQWKMLCTCGTKQWTKHQWISISSTTLDKRSKKYTVVREFYKSLNNEDFDIVYKSLTDDDIETIFQNLGLKDK